MMTDRLGSWPALVVLGGSSAVLLSILALALAPGRAESGAAGAQAPAVVTARDHLEDEPSPLVLPSAVASQADVRRVVSAMRAATRRDLPALRETALASRDAVVAGNAIRALGRLHAFGAEREFLTLLEDERPRVRQEAVAALGLSGDQEGVAPLARLLGDPDENLRVLVIQALGRIGGVQARRHLEVALAEAAATIAERTMGKQALADLGRRTSLIRAPLAPP